MSAAHNENVHRITVAWQPPQTLQLIHVSVQRIDEFWFHLDTASSPGRILALRIRSNRGKG
jgi:hypothetical protein